MTMVEIRCCCTPDNLLGYLPEGASLPLRELTDGTFAYSSEELPREQLQALPGFTPPGDVRAATKKTWRGGKKTWRKTWKKGK